jgi:DNA-binding transcriptional MerR regulator
MRKGDGYSLRDVQRMLGVSRSVVERLIKAGFVSPRQGDRGERRFNFQDVVMLRTANALRTAGVSPHKIVRALTHLRRSGAKDGGLTSLRISAIGRDIAVRDEHSRQWDVESGQLLIDFGPMPEGGSVASLDGPTSARARRAHDAAVAFFTDGQHLEDHDTAAAEIAYRRALEQAPDYTDASLNLGCILMEAERCEEAIDVYRAALAYRGDDPILHFNLGVAWEDAGNYSAALDAYHACIALSDDFADAHFNAARIHEELGDATRAIRHLNQYRKLQRH